MARILVVDDEPTLLHSMELRLSRLGHQCHTAETIRQGKDILNQVDPELAIVDLRLPDGDGLELIRYIRDSGWQFPIVVLTAFASVSSAVTAMKTGATDYIEKPIDLEQLRFVVDRCLETERLKGRLELYERSAAGKNAEYKIIGSSPAIREALTLTARVAMPGVEEASELPTVLITGDTGVGKDLLARYIHDTGPLASSPFVQVNCASLPRELIETELFGHEKGAFTDAKSTKKGLLEIASGGTVFLNEIGELSIEVQSKLLWALERKTIRRVGGTRDLDMNVRVIAATNADLSRMVADKRFREDLFYRLNVFTIHLPPLRERGDDCIELAEYLVNLHSRKYRKAKPLLSADTKEAIRAYPWPGNVRELSHVLERACILEETGTIMPKHLGLSVGEPTVTGAGKIGSQPMWEGITLPEMERRLINGALEHTRGNVSQAARILGVSRGALRRRLDAIASEGGQDGPIGRSEPNP